MERKTNILKKGLVIMKKNVLRTITTGILLTALAVNFAGCGNSSSSSTSTASNDTTASTNSDVTADETPSYEGMTIYIQDGDDQDSFGIADELGYWEDEFGADGITIESVEILGAGPAFLDAVETDAVHFGILGDQPLISGYAAGRNVKIIGTSSEDTQSYRIIVGKDTGITSVSELRGKKIAAQAGTNREKVLKTILEAEGISQDELEIVNLSSTDGITALTSGDVDAVVLYTDFVDPSVGDIITDYTPYGKNVRVIGVSASFAEEYPEIVARVLQVWDRAVQWENEHREEAIAIIKERGEYTDDEAVQVYERETRRIQFTESDAEALDATAQFLYDNGTIDKLITSDEFVDTQYLELAGLLN